jgi:hypothetical protein
MATNKTSKENTIPKSEKLRLIIQILGELPNDVGFNRLTKALFMLSVKDLAKLERILFSTNTKQ